MILTVSGDYYLVLYRYPKRNEDLKEEKLDIYERVRMEHIEQGSTNKIFNSANSQWPWVGKIYKIRNKKSEHWKI